MVRKLKQNRTFLKSQPGEDFKNIPRALLQGTVLERFVNSLFKVFIASLCLIFYINIPSAAFPDIII